MITSSRPAIFAFGWLGAKTKHMNKLNKIYSNMGYQFHSIIQSPLSMLGIQKTTKYEELYNQAIGRPIICHIFSLNGAHSFLKTMTDEQYKFKPGLNIRGLILDSTPGKLYPTIYSEAFSKAIFPSYPFLQKISQTGLSLMFKVFFKGHKKHLDEAYSMINSVYQHPFKAPQLILASENDQIVKCDDIKEYEKIARNSGVYVKSRYWPDSGHVGMFRDHMTEYISLIQDFTSKFIPL